MNKWRFEKVAPRDGERDEIPYDWVMWRLDDDQNPIPRSAERFPAEHLALERAEWLNKQTGDNFVVYEELAFCVQRG